MGRLACEYLYSQRMVTTQALREKSQRCAEPGALQVGMNRRGREEQQFERIEIRVAILAQPFATWLWQFLGQPHEMAGGAEQLRTEGVASFEQVVHLLE